MRGIISLYLLAISLPAQTAEASGERIRAHVRFLADDLLEGRGVGTRGGRLAARYIATQLELVEARPAGDHGTYLQTIPMAGAQTQANATLVAQAQGTNESFRWLDDFVGTSQTQKLADVFESDAIFVGYGISAPEFGWDDFKGADVSGKTLLLFSNQPPSDDPAFFGGPALTYY